MWLARPERGGDTGPLQTGSEALSRCLAALDLVHCTGRGPIDPFPVLQHVPDMAGHVAGLSVDGRTRLLAALSALGVVSRSPQHGSSCAGSGFPSGGGASSSSRERPHARIRQHDVGRDARDGSRDPPGRGRAPPCPPALVGLAAFGAGLTKESGYVFVAALALVALLLARRRGGCSVRRHIVFGGAGLGFAIAVGAGLNVIRYGTPRNAYYLDPGLRTTTVEKAFELGAGLFVAPNGGILAFWPLATILVALLLAVPVVRALRGATSWREAWPALALLAVVAGLTVGLAIWWAPFGWWAWGPRLSLPWVLPILLVAVAAFGSALSPLLARVLTPVAGLAGVAILVVVAALPHVGLVWRPQTIGDFFFRAETAACPGGGPPPDAGVLRLPQRADVDEAPDPARRARRRRDARRRRHGRPRDARRGRVSRPLPERGGRAAQYAPRPLSTAGIVRAMIETSDQIDQFSMYVKSSRTRSSNSSPERPEICQRPVMPGSTR